MRPLSIFTALALLLSSTAVHAAVEDLPYVFEVYNDFECREKLATIGTEVLDGQCHPIGPYIAAQGVKDMTDNTSVCSGKDTDGYLFSVSAPYAYSSFKEPWIVNIAVS
jgi:hypothetical protein